ncbi:hypothetical protein [Paenibacillus arenosi]|uniref:Uncharacterized protein n=1 Tax=Paenibacillus arenosi TaxID=2774142 RepID=A0ABR9AWG0_9BACL|nr:hypothetical protein [Paenibacillus arenosi]MBD8498467.1 hypothetical protein [Paenibacillus arenosi]
MKKLATAALLSAVVLVASSVTVFGNDIRLSQNGASGGWSEDRGYFTNPSNAISVQASSEPDSHTASRKTRERGSVLETNLTGETKWAGVYHYTRARFENMWPMSGYVGDTDRVWGTDATTASTGYWNADLTIAKTYWGN